MTISTHNLVKTKMGKGSWSSQHLSQRDKLSLIDKLSLARQSASEAKYSTKAYKPPSPPQSIEPAFDKHGEILEAEAEVEVEVEAEVNTFWPDSFIPKHTPNPKYIPNPYDLEPSKDLTPSEVLKVMMNQDLQTNGRWVDLERRPGEILALFDAWGGWRYSHPMADWNETLIKREPFKYGPQ